MSKSSRKKSNDVEVTSNDVEVMSNDVEVMSKNVEVVSKNVEKCQKMSKNVEVNPGGGGTLNVIVSGPAVWFASNPP